MLGKDAKVFIQEYQAIMYGKEDDLLDVKHSLIYSPSLRMVVITVLNTMMPSMQ